MTGPAITNHATTNVLARRATFGLTLVAAATIGVVSWSMNAEISSAVIAPGRLVVEGNIKRVQAATAGAVSSLLVRNGDRVEEGDVLLRLEDTQQRATLVNILSQVIELDAKRSRLIAERDDADVVKWPQIAGTASAKHQVAIAEEQKLFALRRALDRAQKERLKARVQQSRRELGSIAAQSKAKARELILINKEKSVVDELSRRQLTNFTRPINIEREVARFEGEVEALSAQTARTESQIHEIELQLLAMEHTRVVEAQRDLREVDARLDELRQRQTAAEEMLARSEIRAPISGIVHDLALHGPGAVLRPGEVALAIVPVTDTLVAEVRIRPQDIDQVRAGQATRVRLSAFNQRTTPELSGTLIRVSPDLTYSGEKSDAHYTAQVRINRDEVRRLGGDRLLVAGMPAEAYIKTGERTLASYIVRPLTDHMQRAFREE